MNTSTRNRLSYRLSIVVGPLSAPFVLEAAGLGGFATMHWAHLLTIICYVFGAIAVSQLLLRWLLGAIWKGNPAPFEPVRANSTPGERNP